MPSALSSLFIAWVQPTTAGLGRRVDVEPRLARLAGDRRGVDDERVAVLGPRGAQQVRALAVEEDHRAQVQVELHVDPLGRLVGDAGAEADARVVDEHVEPAPAVAVGGDDALDLRLVGHVRGDLLDLEAVGAEAGDGRRELVRPAGGDGQAVALLAEDAGDGEADAAGGTGDEGCAGGHAGRIKARPGLLSVAMPLVIIAVLAVVLAAAALAFDGGDEGTAAAPPTAGAARADRRARRAGARAALPAGARSAGGDAGAGPGARRSRRSTRTTRPPAAAADEQVLGLLGLLPPGHRPAQGGGVDLRRGGRRLLRPALGAAAGRAGRADRQAASSTR